MDGCRLVLLTDKRLANIGVSDPVVSQKILEARNALAKQNAAFVIANMIDEEQAKANTAEEAFALVGLTPPLKKQVMNIQLVTALSDGTIQLVCHSTTSPPTTSCIPLPILHHPTAHSPTKKC